MNKFENELNDPKQHLQKQKFRKKAKFSFILCNETYNPDYVTHRDLPEVVNDFMNAKQTAKLMGIPPENTVLLQNATYEQLQQSWNKFRENIQVVSRVLTDKTGILGPNPK